jgi:endogenous inhibitor of DNA gyrase (YacG/DUF329 family)
MKTAIEDFLITVMCPLCGRDMSNTSRSYLFIVCSCGGYQISLNEKSDINYECVRIQKIGYYYRLIKTGNHKYKFYLIKHMDTNSLGLPIFESEDSLIDFRKSNREQIEKKINMILLLK